MSEQSSIEVEPQVTIQAGRASEVFTDARRQAINELATELESIGLTVNLDLTDYIPGRRGISLVEQIGIFIGTSAGSGLIGAIVTDIYSMTKRWARKRIQSKSFNRSSLLVIVRDTDGTTRTFRISKDGTEEESSD